MTSDHIPQVIAIEQTTKSAWTKTQLQAELDNLHGLQFVFIKKGRIAGFIVGTVVAGEAEVRKIAIAPEFRRQKIATALLNSFLSCAKSSMVTACFLELRKSNSAAHNLYKNSGFSNTGIRRNYYSNPKEHAVMMVKKL